MSYKTVQDGGVLQDGMRAACPMGPILAMDVSHKMEY
jgi:hypothetical protein